MNWFKADISEKIVKEYHKVMNTPFLKRDENLRLTLERQIATSVLAQYADKDDDHEDVLDTNSPAESQNGCAGSS